MSRQTAAQIISVGEYLEPDFEPSSLTVSQLLGILGFHDIRYPTPYTKTKLIQVFNDEVKTRASKFKKERLKRENSIANDEGITDGHTGRPLNSKGKAPAPLARRSSRRISSITVEEDSPPQPDPPKRRRSSAQPTFGRTTRKVARAQDTVVEESEPEEGELPIKKVSKTRKSAAAGTQGRRVSHISGEESGWEDNNIFQSAAESSSPIRPSPVRPRVSRASIAPRKSRKSMSAPPQMTEPSSPVRPSHLQDVHRSPPQSPFRPQLPPLPTYNKFTLPSSSNSSPNREEATRFTSPIVDVVKRTPGESDTCLKAAEKQVVSQSDHEAVFDEDLAASERMTQDTTSVRPCSSASGMSSTFLQFLARIVAWIIILGASFSVYNYKVESASIGYCDRGSNTSQSLENMIQRRAAEDACAKDDQPLAHLQSLLNSSLTQRDGVHKLCPLPPLIPLPRPQSCTPCPAHGVCSQFSVACDSGYLLRPNLFLSFIPVAPSPSSLATPHVPQLTKVLFKGVSVLTDGLPGFGSVGLPPRCVEDPKRKRHIGVLGKSIESMLAKERGRRICQGGLSDDSPSQGDPAEVMKWGTEVTKLKERLKLTSKPAFRAAFDDMFNEAIQQLTQWGGVVIGEVDGERYVAHKTADLSWACMVTVKSRELWAAWQSTVLASILTLLIALGFRVRMTQKQKESRLVAGLVQVALDTLRNQELAHYTDPLTAPQPYLSSIQLRDLVLQDEHSVPTRRRLWEQVERIVEGNANVRANLEEIEGGDETRVWRWVGSTGRTPGRKEVE